MHIGQWNEWTLPQADHPRHWHTPKNRLQRMHIIHRSDTDNEFSQDCLMVVVVDDVKQDLHLVLLDWPDVVGSNQKKRIKGREGML